MKIDLIEFIYIEGNRTFFSNLHIEALLENVKLDFTCINPQYDIGRHVLAIKQRKTGNEKVYNQSEIPKKYQREVECLIDLADKIDYDALETMVVMSGQQKLEFKGEKLEQYIENL